MSWRLRLWCADCFGEDPQGCYDGGYEIDDERYGSLEEAQKEADGYEYPRRADPFLDARSRAYPWWRHMDPENGLLALARIGLAASAGPLEEQLHVFDPDAPWRTSISEPWIASPSFFEDLAPTTAPAAASLWSEASPDDIITDILGIAASIGVDTTTAPFKPTPTMQAVMEGCEIGAPLTIRGLQIKRTKLAPQTWTKPDGTVAQIFGVRWYDVLYVHPERWDAFFAYARQTRQLEVIEWIEEGHRYAQHIDAKTYEEQA